MAAVEKICVNCFQKYIPDSIEEGQFNKCIECMMREFEVFDKPDMNVVEGNLSMKYAVTSIANGAMEAVSGEALLVIRERLKTDLNIKISSFKDGLTVLEGLLETSIDKDLSKAEEIKCVMDDMQETLSLLIESLSVLIFMS